MGKRSTSRRLAMQSLYQADISGVPIETSLKNILENESFIPATVEFARELAGETWENIKELDRVISKLSIDWPLDRMGKVDRSILRLALQELKMGKTPTSVVVDEAVEMAKKYSSEEAAKFINGILGAYLSSLKTQA